LGEGEWSDRRSGGIAEPAGTLLTRRAWIQVRRGAGRTVLLPLRSRTLQEDEVAPVLDRLRLT
jgi:hypothetical protein